MQFSQEKNNQQTTHKHSTSTSSLLEIEREYSVPVRQLFSAFASSKAIKAWWWPQAFYTDHVELDFREGGRYFINMKGANQSGGMTGEFEVIIDDELIVMEDQFADERGRVISAKEAKMPGEWPEAVYITFDFSSAGEGKSRVKLSQEGIPNELQADCKQGWSEMFDKLEAYLSDRRH